MQESQEVQVLLLVILFFLKKMKYDEAFAYVKERRPKIQPNRGFVQQLHTYCDSLHT